MRATTAVIAALGVFSVFAASTPARAEWDDYDGGWHRHEWREHQWREHQRQERAWQGYAPPPVAYAPPGYYAPPAAYYAPPPAYYALPPPVYYVPPPRPVLGAPGFSIGFGFR